MILELTENEQIVLLGILEDKAQEEDIREVFPIQDRIAIKSIIQKLGGTYFGKLDNVAKDINVRDKVDWRKELVDDFEKHFHGNTDGIFYHHYCIKCGWDWWSEEAFPNRCSKCGCELT